MARRQNRGSSQWDQLIRKLPVLLALIVGAILQGCGQPIGQDQGVRAEQPKPERRQEHDLEPHEIVQADQVASCRTVAAWEGLDDEGRQIFPPPSKLDEQGTELAPDLAKTAIEIAERDLRSVGFLMSQGNIVFAEHFEPLDGGVMVWINFTMPVDLPHSWGLPAGPRSEGDDLPSTETMAGATEPVSDEEAESMFAEASAAQILVDTLNGRMVWILPTKEKMLCRFGS